tara:strand:+ start:7643 stop:8239 length:597 start_codon:yes stop_codon:yes gene_type:complete
MNYLPPTSPIYLKVRDKKNKAKTHSQNESPALSISAPSDLRQSMYVEGTAVFQNIETQKLNSQISTSYVLSNGYYTQLTNNLSNAIDLPLKDLNGACFLVDSCFKDLLTIRLPTASDFGGTLPPLSFNILIQNSTIQFDTDIFDYSSSIMSQSAIKFPQPHTPLAIGVGRLSIQTSFLSNENQTRWLIKGIILRDYNV